MKASFTKGFVVAKAAEGRSCMVGKFDMPKGTITLEGSCSHERMSKLATFVTAVVNRQSSPEEAFNEAFGEAPQ